MPLPHHQNSQAGRNKFEPVHNNIFEIVFTIPEALRNEFGADEQLLSEQVVKITGLDNINKGPSIVTQKFMGTTRSYLAPKLDDTSIQFEVEFNLNLRGENKVDDYTYKLLRAWNKLGYNMETGETTLKEDYLAEWFKITIANREGTIHREIILKDVMMYEGLSGLDDLDWTSNDPKTITAKFASDWTMPERNA